MLAIKVRESLGNMEWEVLAKPQDWRKYDVQNSLDRSS